MPATDKPEKEKRILPKNLPPLPESGEGIVYDNGDCYSIRKLPNGGHVYGFIPNRVCRDSGSKKSYKTYETYKKKE